MGYYIEGDQLNKINFIKVNGGREVTQEGATKVVNDTESNQAVVVVIDNGMFQAAGYAFSPREFEAFTGSSDTRPKTFMVANKEWVNSQTGYKGK